MRSIVIRKQPYRNERYVMKVNGKEVAEIVHALDGSRWFWRSGSLDSRDIEGSATDLESVKKECRERFA